MDAVGTASNRDVKSLIDEQWCTDADGHFAQPASECVHFACLEILLPELECHASRRCQIRCDLQGGLAGVEEAGRLDRFAIGNEIETEADRPSYAQTSVTERFLLWGSMQSHKVSSRYAPTGMQCGRLRSRASSRAPWQADPWRPRSRCSSTRHHIRVPSPRQHPMRSQHPHRR